MGTFCNQFNDYLENCNIVIVGDFNINWLNKNGSERRQFVNFLKTVDNVIIYIYRNTPKPSLT